MDTRKFTQWTVRLVVMGAMMMPAVGQGQVVKDRKEAGTRPIEIEEITVTAQRREESLQETPISVTALTGATLQQKGASTLLDLTAAAPNLRVSAVAAASSGVGIGIRGLSFPDPQLATQPPVGLYVDGVYIAKIQGSNFDLEDLERVEVLRGPQGTLFGKNTIGGAVNMITRKPTDEHSVTASTEVGNYNAFHGRVTLNVPLIGRKGFWRSDALGTLSLRENAVYKSHDGYFQNTGSGGSEFADLNRVFNMLALRWQPTTDITVDYAFEYHRYRGAPNMALLTFVYPNTLPSVPSFGPLPNRFYAVPYIHTNRIDAINVQGVLMSDRHEHRMADDGNERMNMLTVAWDLGKVGPLGAVMLKSTGAYRSLTTDVTQNLDGTPLHLFDASEWQDVQHWSEELQWIGTAPRVRYVVGAYYYGDYGNDYNDNVFFGGLSNVVARSIIKNESYAVYGQSTWTPPILKDKLSLTVGLRYTQDQNHNDHWGIYPQNPAANFFIGAGKAFGGIHGSGAPGINPLGDIAYQWTDDLMTYFRVARGYKTGGYNARVFSITQFKAYYQPERLLQYELGFKSQWLDNRLRLNAAGYYSDYRDKQGGVFSASTAGAAGIVVNADAEIWGSEVEVVAIPMRGIEVAANYGLTLPKYTKWNQPVFGANGNVSFVDEKNEHPFTHLAQHEATLTLSYTAPPTPSGTFSANVEIPWVDQVNETDSDKRQAGFWATGEPNHVLVHGRMQFVDIPLAKGSLDIAVFVQNLFDKKYRSYAIDYGPSLGYATNNYGDPRTFGLGLTYHFKAS
ncbi:MAG: TonB-dependent receptor [Candidatus Binatia bacterium]